MGILYIDEAGNSGVTDTSQPNLIYGGPYIQPHQWKPILDAYEKLAAQYKTLIYSKFDTPQKMPKSFETLSTQIDFFQNFHFHAKEIANGRRLWGKLNNNQPYKLLTDLISILKDNDVKFHAGMLDKTSLLDKLKKEKTPITTTSDFEELLPFYFTEFEKQIGSDTYVAIIADGTPEEKNILHKTLQSSCVKKSVPELVIKLAEENPFLQLADTGLWTIQAYHRLKETDQSKKAKQIRALYEHLKPILHLYAM